jgi:hypothetical protein
MKTIQTWFLRARHWQIFLLLVVPSFTAEQLAQFSPRASHIEPILLSASSVLWFAWFGSMGLYAQERAKRWIAVSPGTLFGALVYVAIYEPCNWWYATSPTNFPFFALLPFHLLGLLCMLYILYFISKCLVAAEFEQSTSFSEYVGTILAFLFFPIGIWILQPRVNQLYDEKPVHNVSLVSS